MGTLPPPAAVVAVDWPASTVADYIALLKPRVMSLVVFTAGMTLLMTPSSLHPLQTAIVLFSIALGAGASGAFNMWYERELDARMPRTQNRPLVLGKIAPDDALFFSLVCAALALMFLGMAANWLAAFWLLVAMVIYGGVYTVWLKPRTPLNIVWGGASGALPPVIAWAAVTGTTPLEAWALFLIIFLWTPPHFWALALYKADEYRAAGIPMMPVVRGAAFTKQQILLYVPIVVASSLLPLWFGLGWVVYGLSAAALGIVFGYAARRVAFDSGFVWAKRLFGFSMLYLFVLFLVLGVESWLIVRL